MKARVCWAVRRGTLHGHGDWVDLDTAKAWVEWGNRVWPEIYHFLDLRQGAAS